MTPDRIFYPLAALVAGALIALAMVYPQGEGAQSPAPFGHITTQRSQAALALARRNARLELEIKKATDAIKRQQLHDSASSSAPLK